MKKLYKLLLGLLVIFMVACTKNPEKNPYISKEKYSDIEILSVTKDMMYSTVIKINNGKSEESKFNTLENNLLNNVLSTKYKTKTILELVKTISNILDDTFDVTLKRTTSTDASILSFIWLEGKVTLNIPVVINGNDFKVMEISSQSYEMIKEMEKEKNMSKEEKDEMKNFIYDSSWKPNLIAFGEMIEVDNILSGDTLKYSILTRKDSYEKGFDRNGGETFSQYVERTESEKSQKFSPTLNNIKIVNGTSYYNGDFIKDVEKSVKNRDTRANKILINYLYELSSNYIIFAHITESIDTLADTFKEKYSSWGTQEVIKTNKEGQLVYIIFAGDDVKNPIAFLVFNLTVENTNNGQKIYANGENSIIFKGPTSETRFLDIDAIDALTEEQYD